MRRRAIPSLAAALLAGCAARPAAEPANGDPPGPTQAESPPPVETDSASRERAPRTSEANGSKTSGNNLTRTVAENDDARPATAAPRGIVTLAVPGFEPALVSFPPSAPFPQPVVIAAHGAGDAPAWQCPFWRELLGDRGVVLCPAGPRLSVRDEGRYFPDHFTLERIAFAALDALVAAYPRLVDGERAVYTGYSQGATMGALMLPPHGDRCPRLVLVEGGHGEWTLARATTFAKAGGRRVLFACGTRHCQRNATRSVAWLQEAGVDARLVSDLSAGHTYGGRLAGELRAAFDWLVADDPRFTGAVR